MAVIPALARAAGDSIPYDVKGAQTPWKDPKYEDCGQSCHQQHGVNTLAFKFRYRIEKLALIRANDADAEEVKKALGAFCSSGEKPNNCKQRYIDQEHLELAQIRRAMGKANQNIVNLKPRSESKRARVVMDDLDPKSKANQAKSLLKKQAPAIIKWKQVPGVMAGLHKPGEKNQTQEEIMKDVRFSGSPQWVKWAEEAHNQQEKRPTVDLFVNMKQVPVSEDDPDEKKWVPDTKPDGTPKYDMVAFQEAERLYFERMKKRPGRYSQDPKSHADFVNDAAKMLQSSTEQGGIVAKAFANTRHSFISAVGERIQKGPPRRAMAPAQRGPGAAGPGQNASSAVDIASRNSPGVAPITLKADPKGYENMDFPDLKADSKDSSIYIGIQDRVMTEEVKAVTDHDIIGDRPTWNY